MYIHIYNIKRAQDRATDISKKDNQKITVYVTSFLFLILDCITYSIILEHCINDSDSGNLILE